MAFLHADSDDIEQAAGGYTEAWDELPSEFYTSMAASLGSYARPERSERDAELHGVRGQPHRPWD